MISAVVLTKNEQDSVERCLKSVSFCNEILIIDDFSTDNTTNIAKKYASKIFKNKLNNDFSKQRNFGLSKANGEWVLFIDSDEIVSESLKQEITRTLKQNKKTVNGYYVKREDIFLGKHLRFGEVKNIKLLRLARKNKGLWERPVHEIWNIKGSVGFLKNPLIHHSHSSIKDFLRKINYYSSLNAGYLFKTKIRSTVLDIILYPSFKFIHNFVLKLGFLDGFEGFLLSIFMSFHSFLTRAKLFLLNNETKK